MCIRDRPRVDEPERTLVARSGQKILARITFRVIKRERKLARAIGHGGLGRPFAGIERAFAVAPQGKPDQHARRRRKRHSEQEADKAEQIAASKQRKDEPNRMQSDACLLYTSRCV